MKKSKLLTNLKRTFRMGFIDFWRNGSVSVASVIIMTIALSVVGGLLLSRALLNSTLTEVKNKVDINVYFTTGASDDEIQTMSEKIQALPEVANVTYTSKEEELADFKARHENDSLTLQALDEIGDNPLGAALNIRAKDPSQYEGIAQFLDDQKSASDSSIIDKVNYNRNKQAIDALLSIMSAYKKLGTAIAGLFILIAILITFNTIRLTIYMSREEISVMRLVGASTRYIKGPFVVEAIMYGVLGAVLTTIIFFQIAYWAGPYTEGLGTGLNLWHYYLVNCIPIFFILLISGIFVGVVSSYFAVKKYLKI